MSTRCVLFTRTELAKMKTTLKTPTDRRHTDTTKLPHSDASARDASCAASAGSDSPVGGAAPP